MLFWDNVKKLLKENKLTQENLCKKCNISLATFVSWIHNDRLPNADESSRIADALGTSVEYLVTGEEKNELTIEETSFIRKMRTLPEKDRNTIIGLLDLLKKQEEAEN